MDMKRVYIGCIIIFFLAGCVRDTRRTDTEREQESAVITVTVLTESGGRVSWSHALDLIAFDKTGADGYTDIYVVQPDGSGLECLTCNKEVPQLHNGNPSWHPSGEYIVFQAQDPDLKGFPQGGALQTYVASPGVGINNNIWVMNTDGTTFWQLTSVDDHYGTLHPHFSPDGTMLIWSEIISPHMDRIGRWAIKMAEFSIENGTPSISVIKTLQPLTLQLYEVHGFSPDKKKILFSGVAEGKYYYDMEIYTMDVTTGEIVQLTDNDEWDEHAHFTVDGQHIIWVSSEGIPQPRGESLEDTVKNPPKLEYWVMNVDGSGKRRLSGFNDPGAPEYVDIPGGCGLGDFDVGPDGNTIVAKMRTGYAGEVTVLIEVDLDGIVMNVHVLMRIFPIHILWKCF